MSSIVGPEILARTMSVPTRRGKGKKAWQYHSRSDHHSKLICWTILFDLLVECDAFQRDAAQGKIGVAVNHVLVGPINKTLDLVVCRVQASKTRKGTKTFQDLGRDLGIRLTDSERIVSGALPSILLETRDDVSEVVLALEAKACMTAHVKSLPRLHAEILAAGFLAKQAAPTCITVSHTLVNSAPYFISPGTKSKRNVHSQPNDANAVLQMLRFAIPRSSVGHSFGYDVIGASVIECRNDRSDVVCIRDEPAPARNDSLDYERMMRALCGEYRKRFGAG